MTDNFQLYRQFIKACGGLPDTNEKGNLDRYYVVELMRRGKDNPDLPAANYHFRNYYIYSWRDLDRYEQVLEAVRRYVRTMESGYDDPVVFTMPTRTGRHIITHPFNLKHFNDGFQEAVGQQYGIETPTVKKNHLTLLYENLDCIWSRRAKRVMPESE